VSIWIPFVLEAIRFREASTTTRSKWVTKECTRSPFSSQQFIVASNRLTYLQRLIHVVFDELEAKRLSGD
jgi:hypothetical protein